MDGTLVIYCPTQRRTSFLAMRRSATWILMTLLGASFPLWESENPPDPPQVDHKKADRRQRIDEVYRAIGRQELTVAEAKRRYGEDFSGAASSSSSPQEIQHPR